MYESVYRPEQLTREVWDYIFYGGELPKTDIPVESLRYDDYHEVHVIILRIVHKCFKGGPSIIHKVSMNQRSLHCECRV